MIIGQITSQVTLITPLCHYHPAPAPQASSTTGRRWVTYSDGSTLFHPTAADELVLCNEQNSPAHLIWLSRLGIEGFPTGYELYTKVGQENKNDYYLFGHKMG